MVVGVREGLFGATNEAIEENELEKNRLLNEASIVLRRSFGCESCQLAARDRVNRFVRRVGREKGSGVRV
jgi:hypothetical protein